MSDSGTHLDGLCWQPIIEYLVHSPERAAGSRPALGAAVLRVACGSRAWAAARVCLSTMPRWLARILRDSKRQLMRHHADRTRAVPDSRRVLSGCPATSQSYADRNGRAARKKADLRFRD